MSLIARAMEMAVLAHAQQLDKARLPYLIHVLRVAGRCQDETQMIVALLHDVVEDSAIGLDYIRREFGDEIADAVDHLTRREEETYPEFIRRAQQNRIAAQVKLIDVVDHLRQEEAANLKDSLRNRYRAAYKELTNRNWDKDQEAV
jgi:(p)ppGpp synthase/HD superfamily hydrolase